MPQALAGARPDVDGLTLPSEQRDFVAWRRGRQRYAVWALDVDRPALRAISERYQALLADCLLPGYCRQPHVTVHLCGFPAARTGLADDYAAAAFSAQVAALTAVRPAPFVIEIGAPASFSSAAYLSVRDRDGGIAALRGVLAGGSASDDFPYVPHVSFGLYRGAYPLAGVLARCAAVATGELLRLSLGKLSLMSYEAALIGGPLSTLAEFDLHQGGLQVPDERAMSDLFGEAWRPRAFA
ncbi:MAG: 2'-5' RNA ligase family protein [Bacteroidota bacterium]